MRRWRTAPIFISSALAQLTSAGTAVIRFVPGPGSHSYKAIFLGTTGTTGAASSSSSAVALNVPGGHYLSTTAITLSGGPGNYTLMATVTGAGSANFSPTGTVSFLDTTNAGYVLATAVLKTDINQLTFINSSNPVAGNNSYAVTEADFNGDGYPDLAVANQYGNSLTILLGKGDGTFVQSSAPAVSANPNSDPFTLTVGDFNGDGIPDIAVGIIESGVPQVNEITGIAVLLGKGDGTFATPMQTSFPQSASVLGELATADFNGDGKADLVVAGSGVVTVLLGNGDGTFATQPATQLGSFQNPLNAFPGDFNGDGIVDLAVTSTPVGSTAGHLAILLGNGDGTFTAGQTMSLPGGDPLSIVLADFNGDGKADLAISSQTSNLVSVLLGNGDGTFNPGTNPPINMPTNTITVGDFNGDGIPDLAGAHYGPVSVLIGNGDGTFGFAANPPTAGNAFGVGERQEIVAADFNGDGKSDLAEVSIMAGNSGFVAVSLAESTTASATVSGISPVGMGTHLVDASYPGDANFGGSVSGVVALTAEPATTTLTLGASPASSLYNQPVTLTATLAPTTAQNHAATGTVTFYNGGVSLGTFALAGSAATVTVSSLPIGTDALTAVYSGDTNFASSASGGLQYVVAPIPPTLSFTVPNHTFGDPPFLVAATTNSGGAFSYSVVSGPATIAGSNVTLTGAGTVVLQASVAANGTYAAGTINATFTAAKAGQTIFFAAPASPVSYAAGSVTLTATASSGLAVTFSVLSGPATVSGNTLTLTGSGTVVVAADQAGNANYNAAAEVTRTVTVNKSAAMLGLTAAPNPVFLQTPVTLTATVSSVAGVQPTGAVVFSSGSAVLGTATISGGVAALTVATLTLGPNAITAAYGGDANFTALTSPAATESVEDFSLTLTSASAQMIPYGGTATYSLAVSPVGGATFPSAISLALAGAPAGAIVSFTPQTLAAGSGAANVILTIQTPTVIAAAKGRSGGSKSGGPALAWMMLGALLLPLRRGVRLRGNVRGGVGVVMLLAALAAATGLTGCGSDVFLRTLNLNMTVTGTAGALSHTANAALTVQ